MIKILHTADTHNRLTREKAWFLKSLEADLILDSGDIIKSGNVDFNPRGESAWAVYNGVCDAICLGNREYHFSKWGFESKVRGFEMPLLTCNYVDKYASPLTSPYKIFEIDNKKVAVVGVSNINIDESMFCHRFASQYQKDIFESFGERIKEIDCDFLIALTHIGLEKDRILAERFPEICLILGGHSHDFLTEKVGDCVIVHSGAYAQHYSEITIDKGVVYPPTMKNL